MSYDLQILIPVFNEGKQIINVYKKLIKFIPHNISWQVFFIYDFDEDITIPYLNKISKKDKKVILIKQTYGPGVLNALKFGFKKAHEGAVLVVMGDDSDDLKLISKIFKAYQEGAIIVSPSRFSQGGKYRGGNTIKKILTCIAAYMLSKKGIGTKDPTNNFKLYDGQYLKNVKIESKGGFEIALELTVKASLYGKKIVDIPCTWKDRKFGISKFKLFKWLPYYLKWFIYYFKMKKENEKEIRS